MRRHKLKEIRRIQDDIEQGRRNVSSVERQRNPAKAFIEKNGKFHQSRRKLSHCKRAIRECSRTFAVEQPALLIEPLPACRLAKVSCYIARSSKIPGLRLFYSLSLLHLRSYCSGFPRTEQPPDTPVQKDARAGIGRCQKWRCRKVLSTRKRSLVPKPGFEPGHP